MDRKKQPENFTLSLALTDVFPVLFFMGSSVIVGEYIKSALFIAGAALCTFAGLFKVLWKVLLVTVKKNVMIFNKQLRVLMPCGFIMIIISLVLKRSLIDFSKVAAAVLSFPSVILFGAAFILMCCMMIFGIKLDGNSAKSNWIEEITNTLAQGFIFAGLLILAV